MNDLNDWSKVLQRAYKIQRERFYTMVKNSNQVKNNVAEEIENMDWEGAGGHNFEFSKENPILAGRIMNVEVREGDNGPYYVAQLLTPTGVETVASSAWTFNHFKVFKSGMMVRFEFKGKKGRAKVIEVKYGKGELTEEMKKIIFTPNKKKKIKKAGKK